MFCASQTPRPWIPVDHRQNAWPNPTRCPATVWLARIVPVDAEYCEARRNLALNGQIAYALADAADVYLVSWTRIEIHVVLDLPSNAGREGAFQYLALGIPDRWRTLCDIELTDNPDDWDAYHRSRTAERAARELLAGRHQCQDSPYTCVCACRGNRHAPEGVGWRTERGLLIGRGAAQ